jgi:hypothetical protein
MAIPDRRRAKFADVGTFVGELYGVDLYAKRVESLAGATALRTDPEHAATSAHAADGEIRGGRVPCRRFPIAIAAPK